MENFKTYIKIRQLGHEENEDIFKDPNDEIVREEKIDGANFRFVVPNNIPIFGSHNQQLTSDEGEEINVAKNFARCVQYVKKQLKDHKINPDIKHFIFYGECCVQHSIAYDWDKMPPYLGFDVFDLRDGVFLNYKVAKKIFKELGLGFVPVMGVSKAKDITKMEDNDVPKSEYYDGPAEGIIFKNYAKQIMAKYVRTEFKELNAETFGGTPKYEETDTGKIAAKYCVNARIDKIIFKLIDEGGKLEMALMKQLPTRVYADIMEEHWKDLAYSRMTIDFRKLHLIVTKRSLSVLRQVMANNALGEKK